MRIIEPGGKKHDCGDYLPWESGGYGSTGKKDGTLAQCGCGTWWQSLPCYESLGPTTRWCRVRWFSFGAKRRIKEYYEMTGPRGV